MSDVHLTGQPDTPLEVLVALLAKAKEAGDAAEVQKLVGQAHDIAAGLDPYLDQISTPPDQVWPRHWQAVR